MNRDPGLFHSDKTPEDMDDDSLESLEVDTITAPIRIKTSPWA